MLIRTPKPTASYQSFLQSVDLVDPILGSVTAPQSSPLMAQLGNKNLPSWVGSGVVYFFCCFELILFFQSAQHLGLKSCRRSASSRQPYVTASTPTPPLGIAASGDLPGHGVCTEHEKPLVPGALRRGAAQPAVLQASRSFTFYL